MYDTDGLKQASGALLDSVSAVDGPVFRRLDESMFRSRDGPLAWWLVSTRSDGECENGRRHVESRTDAKSGYVL